MSDNQELLKKLKELEEENKILRQRQSSNSNIKVVEGDYKGRPTLTFYGPFKPFTLGIKKLQTIKESWPEVEKFLNRHNANDNNEIKI